MAEIDGTASLRDILLCVEELQNRSLETSHRLSVETDESSRVASLIVHWEREIKELEDNEKKLIDEYDQVMSNLYLLPGYVLAVSTGVSGLLSTDPHLCWLLSNVIVVVVIYIAALWLAVRVAYRHIRGLQAKMDELVAERAKLQTSYRDHVELFTSIHATHPVLEKLENYGNKNSEFEFKAQHYKKILLLIILGGLVYAFMLLVTAWYVLCGAQSKDHVPCTPPTPPCLHSAIPLEPVPDDLPFSPCVPSLRPYQVNISCTTWSF